MRPARASIEAALTRIIAHPRITLAIAALITLAAVASWTRISFSTDMADVVGTSNPAASALSDLQEHFQDSNPLIVLLETADASVDLPAAARAVAAAIEREAEARGIPLELDHPETAPPAYITDLLLPAAPWYLDEAALEELLARTAPDRLAAQLDAAIALLASPAPSAEVVARLRLADPLGVADLLADGLGAGAVAPARLSPDGRTLRIRILSAAGHAPDWPAVIDLVETASRPVLPAGVRLTLTGAPAIATLSEHQTKRDLIRGGVTGSALVALVIVLAYRRLGAILIVLLPAAASIVWAFGLYAWTGLPLTPLTAAGVAILAGLSVDYSIHAASVIRAAPSTSPREAGASLAAVVAPMACACATTVIACAALGLSQIRLLHTLAALGSFGLIAALVASLTVAPALAALARLAASPADDSPVRASRIGNIAALAAGCIAALALAAGLFRGEPFIPFHTSTDVLHPHPNPPLDAEERMDAAFNEQGETVPILVKADTVAALPAAAARVAAAIDASPDLRDGRTLGLHSLLPGMSAGSAGESAAATTPPALQSFWERADPDSVLADLRTSAADAGLSAAAVAGAEPLIRAVLTPSTPPSFEQLRAAGAPLDRFVAADASPPLTVVLYHAAAPLTDRASQRRVIGALRAALAAHPEARLTGYAAIGLEADAAVRRDVGLLIAVAAVGIALCLMLFLRSWWRPLLVFLPVAYALLILLGVMHISAFVAGGGAEGFRLDMISIAALPLLIGVGVDDGVFLVSQHTGPRRQRHSTRAAMHAITATSATTAVAFASLATSAMPALRTFGLAAAIGISAAWVGAVLVLYPLLHRTSARDGSDEE